MALAELAKLDRKIAKPAGRRLVHLGDRRGRHRVGTKDYKEGQIYLKPVLGISRARRRRSRRTSARRGEETLARSTAWRCAIRRSRRHCEGHAGGLFNPQQGERGIFSHTKAGRAGGNCPRDGDQAYAYFRSFMPSARTSARNPEIERMFIARARMRRPRRNTAVAVPWLSAPRPGALYRGAAHPRVRPEIDGCASIPAFQRIGRITVRRRFRGKNVEIEVQNRTRSRAA